MRKEVRALGREDIISEVSYKGGEYVKTGTLGSKRVDVILGTPEKPIAIFDLKTGGARLTPERIAEIRRNLPQGYQNIPILEIR